MKKNLYSFLIAVAAIVLLLAYITNFSLNRRNSYWVSDVLEVSDTMRYGDYKKLKDSADARKRWEKSRVGAFGAPGEGTGVGFIGIRYISECDTCASTASEQRPGIPKYFVQLPGFYFKDEWKEGREFFQKHNFYINSSAPRFTCYPDSPTEPGTVLLPVSESTYNKMNILVKTLQLLTLVVIMYIIVRPVRVLMNIANGKAFDISNYQILKWTGWALIIGSLLTPVLSLIINFCFRSSIPPEVKYFFWDNLLNARRTVIAGIAVLLLAYAFKRGHYLHEEQKQFV
ncbi:MAG: DUF2975 domain-containing protein [Chitinophagaceae bacterium]|nr:MAG: DUF2975 domain-containing protein [Chitinophagaceae bacterium]